MNQNIDYVSKISELLNYPISDFPIDGKTYHFTAGSGSNKPLWAVAHDDGDKIRIHYGDFRTGQSETWFSDSDRDQSTITQEQREQWKRERIQREDKLIKEKEDNQKRAIDIWRPIFDKSEAAEHPYLIKKNIDSCYSAKVNNSFDGKGELLIPIYNKGGNFAGVQRISQDFEKKISSGTQMSGSFSFVGRLRNAKVVHVVEGYATACSIRMALGDSAAILISFNANNLIGAITTLRSFNSECEVIICADDDVFTFINGKQTNVGVNKACVVTTLLDNISVLKPVFKNRETFPTDFNDLHSLEGIEVCRDQLIKSKKIEKIETHNEYLGPMTEQEVVFHLIDKGENSLGSLTVQDDTLFNYKHGVWRQVSSKDEREFKINIGKLIGGKATTQKIESTYKYFLLNIKCPPEGVDMFEPNLNIINFKNCCFKIDKETKKLERHGHSMDDYCTNQIPYDYDETRTTHMNEELMQMLGFAFDGEEDKEEKIDCIKELFGAVFLPINPRIFFLKGVAASGKSTILNTILSFVGYENASTLEPSQFKDFNMHLMVNKLANVNLDLSENDPIKESVLKQIQDGGKMTIQRKYQSNIIAAIPRIHAFACNELPPMKGGTSGAFHRRMSIIDFNNSYLGTDGKPVVEKDRDTFSIFNRKHDQIIASDPQGIINFAFEGIKHIIERGVYTNCTSGREEVTEWQFRDNPVQQFINDDYEVTWVKVDPTERMKRAELGNRFLEWQQLAVPNQERIGKISFYRNLEGMGFVVNKVEGHFYVEGLKYCYKPKEKYGIHRND